MASMSFSAFPGLIEAVWNTPETLVFCLYFLSSDLENDEQFECSQHNIQRDRNSHLQWSHREESLPIISSDNCV